MRGVLVVDDHPVVREVMSATARALFPQAAVRTAGSLAEAIETAQCDASDLVLLDLGLPDATGLAVLGGFRAACPASMVVVFSALEDRETVLAALQMGARGYLPKTSRSEVIAAALRLVVEGGGVYVPPQALGGEARPAAGLPPPDLTARQLDVLRLMAQGLANKQIASRLRIAQDTVKHHAKALYAALGIAGRKQAADAAARRGINLD